MILPNPTENVNTRQREFRRYRRSAAAALKALRDSEVPVIARIRDEAVCFDLCTTPRD